MGLTRIPVRMLRLRFDYDTLSDYSAKDERAELTAYLRSLGYPWPTVSIPFTFSGDAMIEIELSDLDEEDEVLIRLKYNVVYAENRKSRYL